jgi:hypothetical protein
MFGDERLIASLFSVSRTRLQLPDLATGTPTAERGLPSDESGSSPAAVKFSVGFAILGVNYRSMIVRRFHHCVGLNFFPRVDFAAAAAGFGRSRWSAIVLPKWRKKTESVRSGRVRYFRCSSEETMKMAKNRLKTAAKKIGAAIGKADRTAHKVAKAGVLAKSELDDIAKQVEALKRQLLKTSKKLKKALA